jgi:hypothetical protein
MEGKTETRTAQEETDPENPFGIGRQSTVSGFEATNQPERLLKTPPEDNIPAPLNLQVFGDLLVCLSSEASGRVWQAQDSLGVFESRLLMELLERPGDIAEHTR